MATLAPLIVITGPTASGKSGLSLRLAKKYNGEIICADSRTVYRHMDIGTAKPSITEQSVVPHHLLDVVEPGERFTLYDFQKLAMAAIDDIRRRGKVPFLVGGTGLYVDSVVLHYKLVMPPLREERQELESKSAYELQTMLKKLQIQLPHNLLNKRHLIRALEQKGINNSRKLIPDSSTYVVAITTSSNLLKDQITKRAEKMFEDGVVKEAEILGKRFGWDNEAMTGNIYPIIRQVLEGKMTEAQAITTFTTRDRQLAKRQLTWLKRHDYIKWYDLASTEDYLSVILDRWQIESVLV